MNDGSKTSEPEAADGSVTPPAAGQTVTPTPPAAPDNQPVADTAEAGTEYDYQGDDVADLDDEAISWTASEFLAHQKSAAWYLKLAGCIVVLAAVGYLFTRDFISASVVVICGVIFGVYAGHAPRQLSYSMDLGGVTIVHKFYPYELFRSFSVIEEGSILSINLAPLKRFSPGLTIYFDPPDEHRIVDLLSARLPFEDRRHDPVDRLMRRIRF